MVFGAYTIMGGIWQNNQACGSPREAGSGCYQVRDPMDLALLAAILSAAWWDSCGGILHPPRSSWVTQVPWP